MCGIWCFLCRGEQPTRDTLDRCAACLAARGPESQRIKTYADAGVSFIFTRLPINGLTDAGMQPLGAADITLVCNGEIYNHVDLAQRYSIPLSTGSDCEVLAPLLRATLADDPTGITFARSLDGVFALVALGVNTPMNPTEDNTTGRVFAARDPYGVRPLFVATLVAPRSGTLTPVGAGSGGWALASEMKAFLPIMDRVASVTPFPPGHVAWFDLGVNTVAYQRYHSVPWLKSPAMAGAPAARAALRVALQAAVNKRLMSDRPMGCLLSGGLDSSLVAALVQRACIARGAPPVHTFSIGMDGSIDLRCARIVADHIGSVHHEVKLSEDDFFAAIPKVVADIESYDITTVRASVGNYLVSKYIRENTDIKVVFNGDGSDEVLGGYLYFYNAPSDEAFEAETGRLLDQIHLYDVLRSDRSISSHGLEARTPFLDRQFVATAMSVATDLRRPIRGSRAEKQILREAFSPRFEGGWPADDVPLLPPEILSRTKEAFSDGVSGTDRSWRHVITDRLAHLHTGAVPSADAYTLYSHNPPYTAESLWYRELFDLTYSTLPGAVEVIPRMWLARWSGDARDPSAHTLAVYAETVGVVSDADAMK